MMGQAFPPTYAVRFSTLGFRPLTVRVSDSPSLTASSTHTRLGGRCPQRQRGSVRGLLRGGDRGKSRVKRAVVPSLLRRAYGCRGYGTVSTTQTGRLSADVGPETSLRTRPSQTGRLRPRADRMGVGTRRCVDQERLLPVGVERVRVLPRPERAANHLINKVRAIAERSLAVRISRSVIREVHRCRGPTPKGRMDIRICEPSVSTSGFGSPSGPSTPAI